MKTWTSILAAAVTLALAAPAANAVNGNLGADASSKAGRGIVGKQTVPSKSFRAFDPLAGQHRFLAQVHQPRSVAAAQLQARLDRGQERAAGGGEWQLLPFGPSYGAFSSFALYLLK